MKLDREVVGEATGGNAVANPALTSADRDLLTNLLEAQLREYIVKGTKTRVNLRPHAERDKYGKLKEKIPSDVVTDGPIFYLVKLLNPDLHFQFITINKFTKADECEHHFDTGNKGPSRLIMFGNFVGGGLLFLTTVVCSQRNAFGMNMMFPR